MWCQLDNCHWRPIISEWHADERTNWEWILPDHALPSTQATTIAFKAPADLGTAIKRNDFVFVDRTQKKITEPRGLWLVRLENNKKPPTLVQIHLTHDNGPVLGLKSYGDSTFKISAIKAVVGRVVARFTTAID